MVYTFRNLFVLQEYALMLMTSTKVIRNKIIDTINFVFFSIHSELIVKYNIGLKTLLQQGISEPVFNGDLVYKFKRIVKKPCFSDQFKKINEHYKRVGYNMNSIRQSACRFKNPITVDSYGFLFNCTTVGQALESMTALLYSFNQLIGACCLSLAGPTVV